MFSRIMYVTVFVSNQDKALDFYTNNFGFQKRADYSGPEGRFLTIALKDQGFEILLWLGNAGQATTTSGLGTLFIESDDLRKDFADLKARGVEFVEPEPEAYPFGMRVTALDPTATGSLCGRRENDLIRMVGATGMNDADLQVFERARLRLLGLAYRILGSRADAEDAVQDCFFKWRNTDRAQIKTPVAWLTSVCTRRCLDMLRAADRAKVNYVGPWLPDPIHPVAPPAVDDKLATSLTTAFLLLLERLTPKERAAYLLYEIFDQPYAEIAAMLEMDEAACRKLVSRARQNVDHDKVRHVTPKETQDDLLRAFESAVMSGSTHQLAALLSSDIRLTTDTGGKTVAATRILEREDVFNALTRAHGWWEGCQWEITDMNGSRGAILSKNGRPALTIGLSCNEAGLVSDIFITLNPAKLARLEPVDIH